MFSLKTISFSEELLKDDTSSIDSSIDEISKAEESNHVQQNAETPMETEDSLPEKLGDLPTVETVKNPEITVVIKPEITDVKTPESIVVKTPEITAENNILEQNSKVQVTDKPERSDKQVIDSEARTPSPVPEEEIPAKEVTAVNEANVPKKDSEEVDTVKELVKKVISLDKVSHPKEVLDNKVPKVKEVQQVAAGKETSAAKEEHKIQEQVLKIPKIPNQDKEIIKVKKQSPQKEESKPKEVLPVTLAAPIQKEPIKEKSPIREVITLAVEAPKAKDQVESKVPKQPSPVNEKEEDVEMIEVPKKPQVDVKNEKNAEAPKTDVKPVNGDIAKVLKHYFFTIILCKFHCYK